MFDREKKWVAQRLNAYFLFIAVAFGISAYLLLVDNSREYWAKVNILVSPKNTKTAIHLDKARENIFVITEKINLLEKEVSIKKNDADSLIEIQVSGKSEAKTLSLMENSARDLLDSISRYYDVKNDLSLEIVSREAQVKIANKGLIFLESIAIGLILSFLVQLLLDLVEKIILLSVSRKKIYNKQKVQAQKELDNFFKLNREKIQKLTLSFPQKREEQKEAPVEKTIKKDIPISRISPELFTQRSVGSKKASSPANLPIAEEDLNKIVQLEARANTEPFMPESMGISSVQEKKELIDADELKEAFREPTEEEFKKRLNQLLGNK